MKRLLLPVLACAAIGQAHAACPPRDAALRLKADKFAVADGARRQAMALDMLDCLRSPDPLLRDEVGFEALAGWMRGGLLEVDTVRALHAALLARLNGAAPDPLGVERPFAALALAEVARVDRIKPFLNEAERGALVRHAATYLAGVRDYRGYSETEGWRHGVAHAADLMLQLALNPALGRAEHDQMLAALAAQVVPADAHFYIYGEAQRLIMPVYYVGKRDTLSAAEWDAWFGALAAKGGGATTQATLARQHNLKAFLLALYQGLQETPDAAIRGRMLPAVQKALKQLN